MSYSLARIPGQTRLGAFTNFLDRVDRETCGGWYFHVHIGDWRLELYSTV